MILGIKESINRKNTLLIHALIIMKIWLSIKSIIRMIDILSLE